VAAAAGALTPHPEVDAHSRDEVAGEEEPVTESDQQTRLAYARISQQHHLHPQ